MLVCLSLLFWISSCGCLPLQDGSPDVTDLATQGQNRQLSTGLFAQFLTSFPFFLTTPIQNLISWIWSIIIYALIWVIIAVAAFKYFTRKKFRKTKSKKTSQVTTQQQSTTSILPGNPFATLDQNALIACASCPLLLPYLQGMGGMTYQQQVVPYGSIQAPVPQLPQIPDLPFPELPPSPATDIEDPEVQDEIAPPATAMPPVRSDIALRYPDSDLRVAKPEFVAPVLPPLPIMKGEPYVPYPQYPKRHLNPAFNPSRSGEKLRVP